MHGCISAAVHETAMPNEKENSEVLQENIDHVYEKLVCSNQSKKKHRF